MFHSHAIFETNSPQYLFLLFTHQVFAKEKNRNFDITQCTGLWNISHPISRCNNNTTITIANISHSLAFWKQTITSVSNMLCYFALSELPSIYWSFFVSFKKSRIAFLQSQISYTHCVVAHTSYNHLKYMYVTLGGSVFATTVFIRCEIFDTHWIFMTLCDPLTQNQS